MTYYAPGWIITDFLRHRVTDPRSRSETAGSDSFTASASQTDFTITPTESKFSCVTSVTVDAVTKLKNQDYWVDIPNRKVKFFTAMTGGEAVVVNFKEGSDLWVWPNKPKKTLDINDFPALSVTSPSSPGETTGVGEDDSDTIHNLRFQIDIWTKEGQSWSDLDGYTRGGSALAEYLAGKVLYAFKKYMSDLHPAFKDLIIYSGPRPLPFDLDRESHHWIVEVGLTQINPWEVDWK